MASSEKSGDLDYYLVFSCIYETKLGSSFPNVQVHLLDIASSHLFGTVINQEKEK